MSTTPVDLTDLVRQARQHTKATEQRAAIERARRSWQPTALVLVETSVTCLSCGHTVHCASGVLVRYKRNRNGVEEIHETDSPHSLTTFSDLPRQIRHRDATTRACNQCFLGGDIARMLPYVDKLRLRHNGNETHDDVGIDPETLTEHDDA